MAENQLVFSRKKYDDHNAAVGTAKLPTRASRRQRMLKSASNAAGRARQERRRGARGGEGDAPHSARPSMDRRTGGSAPAHRGRVPARHGPRSTAAPRRNGSDALSHRRACAGASRRSLNLSPLPSVLCCLSSAQRGRGGTHHHVAPGSRRPEPGTPESGAGSQSPAPVPQLQPPPAAVRGRLSQTAVTTEHSLLYSRTQCPPCQYINFLIALLIN